MPSEIRAAGTVVNDAGYGDPGVTWNNPGNATTEDGTNSVTFPQPGAFISNYIKATNFGFSRASGETIEGVTFRIKYKGFAATQDTVKLVKGGSVVGTNKSTGASLPGSLNTVAFGGASDLHGTTLTYSDVNASTFGVVFAIAGANMTSFGEVDYIEAEVHYSAAPDAVGTMGNPSGAWIRFMRK